MSDMQNERHDRWYGLRAGDEVEERAFGSVRKGTVVSLDPIDNNAVRITVDGEAEPRKAVAEWCTVIRRVEDVPAAVDWYERRQELAPDQIFTMYDGSVIMLDRRVPGDGSAWYVLEKSGDGWSHMDTRIEPGDLVERLEA